MVNTAGQLDTKCHFLWSNIQVHSFPVAYWPRIVGGGGGGGVGVRDETREREDISMFFTQKLPEGSVQNSSIHSPMQSLLATTFNCVRRTLRREFYSGHKQFSRETEYM